MNGKMIKLATALVIVIAVLLIFVNGTSEQYSSLTQIRKLNQGYIGQRTKVYNPKYKGATIAHIHIRGKGYGSGSSKRLFKHFKKIGINSVQLNTFVYQPDVTLPQMYERDDTLRLSDLKKEIQSLHKAGFSVYLKPHLWPGNSWKPKVWRDKIDIKNTKQRKQWFNNYWKFLQLQMKIAIDEEVEIFAIGTEFSAMSKYSEGWLALITKIRKMGYHGLLSYAALAYNAPKMKFWHKLDVISLNFYYPYHKLDENKKILREYYAKKMLPFIQFAKAKGKQIFISEVGFPSHKNAILKPWSWPEKLKNKEKKSNLHLQSKGYSSLFSMLQHSNLIQGVWVWKYVSNMNSYESKKYEKGFNLENKPVEKIIHKYYTGNKIKVN